VRRVSSAIGDTRGAQTQNAPVCEGQSGAEGRNVPKNKNSSTQASRFAFVPKHDLRWEAGLFYSFEQLHSRAISRSPVQNAERSGMNGRMYIVSPSVECRAGGTDARSLRLVGRPVFRKHPPQRTVPWKTIRPMTETPRLQHAPEGALPKEFVARGRSRTPTLSHRAVSRGMERLARCAHDVGCACGEHGATSRTMRYRTPNHTSRIRTGSRPLCRPSTANGSSFRVCSARRKTSRSCDSDLDTPSSTTYTSTFRRTSLVYGSGHLPLASTVSVVDEGRWAMQAGFMQPRDSVASRNSARRHWPYDT